MTRHLRPKEKAKINELSTEGQTYGQIKQYLKENCGIEPSSTTIAKYKDYERNAKETSKVKENNNNAEKSDKDSVKVEKVKDVKAETKDTRTEKAPKQKKGQSGKGKPELFDLRELEAEAENIKDAKREALERGYKWIDRDGNLYKSKR